MRRVASSAQCRSSRTQSTGCAQSRRAPPTRCGPTSGRPTDPGPALDLLVVGDDVGEAALRGPCAWAALPGTRVPTTSGTDPAGGSSRRAAGPSHGQSGGAPSSCEQAPEATTKPRSRARSARSRTSHDLPMPGSPTSSAVPARPRRASLSSRASAIRSATRPIRRVCRRRASRRPRPGAAPGGDAARLRRAGLGCLGRRSRPVAALAPDPHESRRCRCRAARAVQRPVGARPARGRAARVRDRGRARPAAVRAPRAGGRAPRPAAAAYERQGVQGVQPLAGGVQVGQRLGRREHADVLPKGEQAEQPGLLGGRPQASSEARSASTSGWSGRSAYGSPTQSAEHLVEPVQRADHDVARRPSGRPPSRRDCEARGASTPLRSRGHLAAKRCASTAPGGPRARSRGRCGRARTARCGARRPGSIALRNPEMYACSAPCAAGGGSPAQTRSASRSTGTARPGRIARRRRSTGACAHRGRQARRRRLPGRRRRLCRGPRERHARPGSPEDEDAHVGQGSQPTPLRDPIAAGTVVLRGMQVRAQERPTHRAVGDPDGPRQRVGARREDPHHADHDAEEDGPRRSQRPVPRHPEPARRRPARSARRRRHRRRCWPWRRASTRGRTRGDRRRCSPRRCR